MTAPDPHRPWMPPTAPQPTVQPKRKLKPLQVALLSLLGLVVLCCGGSGIIAAFTDPDDQPPANEVGVQNSVAPRFVVPPTTNPPGAAEPSPSVRPSETTSTPTPRKTTRATTRPAPKPTTKKPTTKPTTKPPAKTVTPGAFCSPEGATGVGKNGKVYRCIKKAGEKQARWRQP